MNKTILGRIHVFLFVCGLFAANLPAQQMRKNPSTEEDAYGSNFFDQLHTIFGRFRDMDLQRVFSEAKPIQCSELIGRKGEWRSVAFFNEDRNLGDWYRKNLEEVKGDLAVYTFKGKCSTDQESIQVSTEFPTEESAEAYNEGRIGAKDIDITVNDAVNVRLNRSSMAYTFELPYLFLTDQRGSKHIYSFIAPNRDAAYATEVTSRWECKTVSSEDVTYRFLICRTATVPRSTAARNRQSEPSFGSSAFFILSDGMEATSSVKILLGDGTGSIEQPADAPPASSAPKRPVLKRDGKIN
jgi:hypothetical protein